MKKITEYLKEAIRNGRREGGRKSGGIRKVNDGRRLEMRRGDARNKKEDGCGRNTPKKRRR